MSILSLHAAFLSAIASALHSPSLLPETFDFEGKRYEIAYERADDDSYIRFTAYQAASPAAVLELR